MPCGELMVGGVEAWVKWGKLMGLWIWDTCSFVAGWLVLGEEVVVWGELLLGGEMTWLRIESHDWGRLGGFLFGRGGMEINGINGGELEEVGWVFKFELMDEMFDLEEYG